MAFFSLFKVLSLILGGIAGLVIFKKIKSSKSNKTAAANRSRHSQNRNKEQEKARSYERENDDMIIEKTIEDGDRSVGSDKTLSRQEEKNTRMELKTLLVRVSELIGRGFDQSQIARSLASNSEKEVPKHELAPLVDALKRFLSGYDEKSVKAQEKYNAKAQNDYKAIDELKRGNPDIALDILKRKLGQLEASAGAMKQGDVQMQAMAQAAEFARHIAVLSAINNTIDSYAFAQKSVELNPHDIKSLDLLGYYELDFDNLSQAQKCFENALSLDNSGEDRVWAELAHEGLEIIKSKKPDGANLKGPDKLKSSVRINDIAMAMEQGHERVE